MDSVQISIPRDEVFIMSDMIHRRRGDDMLNYPDFFRLLDEYDAYTDLPNLGDCVLTCKHHLFFGHHTLLMKAVSNIVASRFIDKVFTDILETVQIQDNNHPGGMAGLTLLFTPALGG